MGGDLTALFEAPGDALPRPLPNCYWLVAGRVLAGEYPAPRDASIASERLAALIDAGVRQFVDLTEAGEPLAPYTDALADIAAGRGVAVTHRRFAIPDLNVPTIPQMRATLAALHAALHSPDVSYLHCRGGIGRTGTVAGCLLVQHGFTAERALALIDRKWRVMPKAAPSLCSPETVAQREMVLRWAGVAKSLTT